MTEQKKFAKFLNNVAKKLSNRKEIPWESTVLGGFGGYKSRSKNNHEKDAE